MKNLSNNFPSFPSTRLRRVRSSYFSKLITSENNLSVNDLIMPLFVTDGIRVREEIKSMPGIYRYSLDTLMGHIDDIIKMEIPAIALFPRIDSNLKDSDGSLALDPDNLICRVVKKIKSEYPNLGVICDVALDPYTDHGHDGLLVNGIVDNDKTLNILVEQAILQAEAGCDAVAPSDMMDGRVAAIRLALDDNGHQETQIISYAAKYASSFYGPFRDAVGSKNSNTVIDKSSYQMNPANSNEAIREISLDINEGADMVIVKPGMPYLDIIYRASSELKFPTLAYQVSGEYAMIKHAAEKNFLDLDKAIIESLLSFKRAGACGILSYFSIDAAKLIKNL
ncbi:MAG: porphobilinogen synthase [bacterium]